LQAALAATAHAEGAERAKKKKLKIKVLWA